MATPVTEFRPVAYGNLCYTNCLPCWTRVNHSKGVSWQSLLTRFINLLTAVVYMNLELLAAFVD